MSKKLAERRPIVRLALSHAELAMSIGVSVASIDLMVQEGALPHPRKWHSRKLWLVSEVEAHLSQWPSEGGGADDGWSDYDAPRDAPSPLNGPGGFPVPRDRADPVAQYYESIGFDPLAMDTKDMARLQRKADDEWSASIPGTPLGKRERETLKQLAEHRAGVAVKFSLIKGCGPDTIERLKARGFLETRPNPKHPERIGSYVLTKAGLEAWQALGR